MANTKQEEIIDVTRLLELTRQHKIIMVTKNILVSVYTNASGFLWSAMKVDSGTDLGWSGFEGNCKNSGTFLTYEDALEDALILIQCCDLNDYQKAHSNKPFHWGNYADFIARYR